jgi:prolyl-tRNA editing enzyme YbaK/EbsC (Cys-tRNA(Pro) deacylase)
VPMLVDPELLRHETVLFAAGLETESVQSPAGKLFRDEPLAICC